MPRLTTIAFIEKAKGAHGDLYDYSLTEYKSARERVRVLCKIHGEFLTPAGHHASGTGCPECGRTKVENSRRSTLEDFSFQARKIHGDRYDYSETIYRSSKLPLRIRCPEHGAFEQRAGNHLSGHGCPKCARIVIEESRRLHSDEFFERAGVAHNHFYSYPPQEYSGPETLLKVICPEHGLFLAGARNHLWNKRRCPKCALRLGGELRRIKPNEWLVQARSLHGTRYEYDLADFNGGSQLVHIKCSKHGWFYQLGHKHLAGQGCKKCARERLIGRWRPETLTPEHACEPCFFYYLSMHQPDEAFYKVGITNDLTRRQRTLQASGYSVKLIFSKLATRKECLELEMAAFEAYDEVSGYVPKIAFPGSSECFSTDILGLDPTPLLGFDL